MQTLVSASARFAYTPDGTLWSQNPSLEYRFWTRYLDVYDTVELLVRAKPIPKSDEQWHKVSGHGIKPATLPHFIGPSSYLANFFRLRKAISPILAKNIALHVRLPCVIGTQLIDRLDSSRPYGVEVVGDPLDVFAPGAVAHPLRRLFRWQFSRQLRRQCSQAVAISYVTESALQLRYPPAPGAFSTHYSSIALYLEAFATDARPLLEGRKSMRLLMIGSLAQMYKGPDVLIAAVGQCVRNGLDINLVFVGDGRYRAQLELQTTTEGLADRVHFRGQLPAGDAIREELDKADLFVLPSRTEGLPRAMIEAMARALPCIGTTVGGIPELLPPEDLAPPNDVDALAQKIYEVITNPERMARMSERNLAKALEYVESVLRQRRNAFYRYVKDHTIEWHRRKQRGSLPLFS